VYGHLRWHSRKSYVSIQRASIASLTGICDGRLKNPCQHRGVVGSSEKLMVGVFQPVGMSEVPATLKKSSRIKKARSKVLTVHVVL